MQIDYIPKSIQDLKNIKTQCTLSQKYITDIPFYAKISAYYLGLLYDVIDVPFAAYQRPLFIHFFLRVTAILVKRQHKKNPKYLFMWYVQTKQKCLYLKQCLYSCTIFMCGKCNVLSISTSSFQYPPLFLKPTKKTALSNSMLDNAWKNVWHSILYGIHILTRAPLNAFGLEEDLSSV